jgi:ribonuclease P protein component
MNTFTKEERLRSRLLIGRIFADGSSFFLFPLAIHYLELPAGTLPFPAQMTISVAKKRFKRAVDRNLLKRRLRELYRLNKANFYTDLNNCNKQVVFLVSYSAKEIMTSEQLASKLVPALDRLVKELNRQEA